MLKLKKEKTISKIKNKDHLKAKKIFKNIGKTFLFSAIFVCAADYSITNYLDNKVNKVVTKEQRTEFDKITQYNNREEFLKERLNYNYYNETKYQNDLKIMNDFNNELKVELETLYKNNKYFKEKYPQYENFDTFFKAYNESNYPYLFEIYYLYQKDKNRDVNSSYIKIKNNPTFYVNDFFWGKIIKENKGKGLDYGKLYSDIFKTKTMTKIEKINIFSKDIFIYERNFSQYMLNRLVVENEIPSFQLNQSYNVKVFDEKMYFKYDKKDEKSFTPENVRERLNYKNKSKNIQKGIDEVIANYFEDKPLTFESANIRNTLMILNARSDYQNNMLKIYDIRNENKNKLSKINYDLYNFINIINANIYYRISGFQNYDNIEFFSIFGYKNENQKINYLLSGINNDNNNLNYKSEAITLERKDIDYKY